MPTIRSINNQINLSTSKTSNDTTRYGASADVGTAAYRLKGDGLIEENSLIGIGLNSQTTIVYRSEKDTAQWNAYNSSANEVGKIAADYLEEMVSERRDLANSYFDQIYSLAEKLYQIDEPDTRFIDEFEDYVNDYNANTENKSTEKEIEKFWKYNHEAIEDLKSTLDNLKNFPKDLEGWLLQKGDDISNEVHLFVDQSKNSWVTNNDSVPTDFKPYRVDIGEKGDGSPNSMNSLESHLTIKVYRL